MHRKHYSYSVSIRAKKCDFSLDVYDAEYSYTYIRELTPELTKRGFCEKDLCGNPEAQNCVNFGL